MDELKTNCGVKAFRDDGFFGPPPPPPGTAPAGPGCRSTLAKQGTLGSGITADMPS